MRGPPGLSCRRRHYNVMTGTLRYPGAPPIGVILITSDRQALRPFRRAGARSLVHRRGRVNDKSAANIPRGRYDAPASTNTEDTAFICAEGIGRRSAATPCVAARLRGSAPATLYSERQDRASEKEPVHGGVADNRGIGGR
ncbi:hypothetical protein GORHZ_215_00050 [Gordonia rhizosphera NBRC 16068]|uniref:Uncharacterized protein n=1 Tax=Gordonia rhizosphera NBRC 16068 TaxID=1108045 RepID=K6W2I4_9ACTN|nr:hypothetical protein GORHZ_215_00050 [Gordonia rhizosphera NBRC 16068]